MSVEISGQDFVARKDSSRQNAIAIHEVGTKIVHSVDDFVEIGRELCLPNPRDTSHVIYVPVPPVFDYSVPPTNLIVSGTYEGSGGSGRGVFIADSFGGNSSFILAPNIQIPRVIVSYDANMAPGRVLYGDPGIKSILPSGTGSLNHGTVPNVSRLLGFALIPTGHVISFSVVGTSWNSYTVQKWDFPEAANRGAVYNPPDTYQGGADGGLAVDYDNGFIFICNGTRNGVATVRRVSWDGAIVTVLDYWSNSTSSPQPVPSGIIYCPRDNRVYYTVAYNAFASNLEIHRLYSVNSDGSDRQLVTILNPERNSISSYTSMEYNAASDMLYIAMNVEGREGEIWAYSREGRFLGVVADIPNMSRIHSIKLAYIED